MFSFRMFVEADFPLCMLGYLIEKVWVEGSMETWELLAGKIRVQKGFRGCHGFHAFRS